MPQIYEGMFLIDNDAVRAGWAEAKAVVTDTLAKHGGTIHTARRWDERKLAYTIKGRNRATYLLCYYELPRTSIPAFVRDVEIKESVLRHLQVRVDAVPTGELELSQAELADGFEVPEPPPDEVPVIAPELVEEPAAEPPPAPAEESSQGAPEEEPEAEESTKRGAEDASQPAEAGASAQSVDPEPALASTDEEGKEG